MKHLFLSMAAVAMLASCSSEEIIDKAPAQKSAIGFSTFVDKSTRGASDDINTDNITNFSVWGYVDNFGGTVLTKEAVTYNKDKKEWGYYNTQYWNIGHKYYFTAIAPTTVTDTKASWTYTPSGINAGTLDFKNGAGTTDMLYSYKTADASSAVPTDKVGFTFGHMLSRVKFEFDNDFENSNVKLKITSVKINDAVSEATCNIAEGGIAETGAWTATQNATGALDFGAGKQDATTETNCFTDHKYMIPLNLEYSMTFTVEMYQDKVMTGEWTHDVSVPAVQMKPGYSYVFKATLDSKNIDSEENPLSKIEFKVTSVGGWGAFETVTPGIDVPVKKQ